MVNIGGFLIALHFWIPYPVDSQIYVEVDTSRVLHSTSNKFLSIALDSSIIPKGWRKFDLNSPLVVRMVSALSPAYLRFGGTVSDRLIFDTSHVSSVNYSYPTDGESCINGYEDCALFQKNFTLSGTDWLKINKFAQAAGLDLIFDVNVLLRNGKHWDPTNAIKLINYSRDHELSLSWQLGNEPNSFEYVFGKPVPGRQLAKDFAELRGILDSVYGSHVKLVGPDITRPRVPRLDAIDYLMDFLKEIRKLGNGVIDAVSWHHYYLDGRNSTLEDYMDPSNFKIFYAQTQLVKSLVTLLTPGLPIWITETSDAYGGGTPNITDRFVGGFLWMDKLGSAAVNGIQVVARQCIYGGDYALIDKQLKPNPDFWLSVLHKKLVGPKVLGVYLRHAKQSHIHEDGRLRFYAHCAPQIKASPNRGAITLFGYNIGSQAVTISLGHDLELVKSMNVYTLTAEEGLQSRYTLLNGRRLELNEDGTLPPLMPNVLKSKTLLVPPFAMVFLQIIGLTDTVCD
ncbi:heparanase-like isoform X2 [Ischnura elegans]|nr:heparanase-like isoform X2 [Ischnura elegans]